MCVGVAVNKQGEREQSNRICCLTWLQRRDRMRIRLCGCIIYLVHFKSDYLKQQHAVAAALPPALTLTATATFNSCSPRCSTVGKSKSFIIICSIQLTDYLFGVNCLPAHNDTRCSIDVLAKLNYVPGSIRQLGSPKQQLKLACSFKISQNMQNS